MRTLHNLIMHFKCTQTFLVNCSHVPPTTGSRAFTDAQFGEGSGAVFLEQLWCNGTETSLLDCLMFTPLGISLCNHSDDAGIRCYGMYVLHGNLYSITS